MIKGRARITKCKNCLYESFNFSMLENCSKCDGELEVIAQELNVEDKR